MPKITGYFLLAVIFFCTASFAQSPQIKKKVKLYEFKPGQEIIYNETGLSFAGGKETFFITWSENDPVTGYAQYYTETGGKIYGPAEMLTGQVNYDPETAGFFVTCLKGSSYYTVINGTEYGPFDAIPAIYQENGYKDFIILPFSNELIINGKKYGPYDEVYSPYLTPGGTFAFTFSRGGKYFFHVNGKEYGPYDGAEYASLSNKPDKYLFSYTKDANLYYNVSGNINGPYFGSGFSQMTPDGESYFYTYYDAAMKYYFNLNGIVYGPYIKEPMIYSNEDGFICAEVTVAEGECYIITGNDQLGPFRTTEYAVYGAKGKNFMVPVTLADGTVSYLYNGKELLRAQSIPVLTYSNYDASAIIFAVEDPVTRKQSVYINGKKIGEYQSVNGMIMSFIPGRSDWMISYLENDLYHIIVNDKKYGPYDASDVWSVLFSPGGDFVLPVFDKEGNMRIIRNGTDLGVTAGALVDYVDRGDEWGIVLYTDDFETFLNGKSLGKRTFGLTLGEDKNYYFSIEDNVLYVNYF